MTTGVRPRRRQPPFGGRRWHRLGRTYYPRATM